MPDDPNTQPSEVRSESASDPVPRPRAIVGVGASAGGLAALRRFLGAMPENTGLAIVVIQHLDPNHESMMAELLSRSTRMTVRQVEEDMLIEPDHVYIIPPNSYLTLDQWRMRLTAPLQRRGRRMPIDYFFHSLAETRGRRAICIILSGTGSDGTLGLKDVKSAGGMAMAEDPDTAEYDGMPRSAVATGQVDLVLPVEQMPATLMRYVQHPYVVQTERRIVDDESSSDQVRAILAILRSRTDYDFGPYKRGTMTRRIERRMGLNQIDTFEGYIELVREDPEEVMQLFRDLLIGVTSFFRDGEVWEILKEQVIRKIVAAKGLDDSIRVWVPGCSTGEEAYSVAMLIYESAIDAQQGFNAKIFATDIDPDAIQFARAARYPPGISADISDARLERFFDVDGDDYLVRKKIRESVVLAPQNLISDPPFSNLDLICCRNLLIYLNADVQSVILERFHFALNEGGYLFQGSSESLAGHDDLFDAVSPAHRIYRKTGQNLSTTQIVPLVASENSNPSRKSGTHLHATHAGAAEVARQVLMDRYVPASVLINAAFEVSYFHGSTRDYLDYPTGVPTRDLMQLCLNGLKAKLRAAVQRAISDQRLVTEVAPRVNRGGRRVAVRITVEPVKGGSGAEKLYLVSFQDSGESEEQLVEVPPIAEEAPEVLSELECELQSTREDLQSTIEELETSYEELQASNEEVMSMNEELQSTNEELETSREELQSLNEELTTLNSQLEEKIKELEITNDDLSNLLSSSEIATVFLDNEMRIRRYTPAAGQLVNLIPSDVGRSFRDITLNFTDEALLTDARQVLERLVPAQKEIRDHQGKYYNRRILPYRTTDNRIGGVVITFSDITELKDASERIRARERQQAAVAQLGQLALETTDLDALFTTACQQLAEVLSVDLSKLLELLPEERKLLLRAGVGWTEGAVGQVTINTGINSQAGYTLESSTPVIVRNLANETRFNGPPLLWENGVVSGVSVIIGKVDAPWGILGAHQKAEREFTLDDINFMQSVANVVYGAIAQSETQHRLRESEQRYRLVTDAMPVLIAYCDKDLVYRFCNASYEAWFDVKREDVIGKTIVEFLGQHAYDSVREHVDRVLAGETHSFQAYLPYRRGLPKHVFVEYIAHKVEGEVVGYFAMVQDVSWRVEAEEALKKAHDELRRLNESLERRVEEQTREILTILRNLPALYALLDRDLNIRFVNRQFENAFVMTEEELLNLPFREILTPMDYARIEARLHAASEGRTQIFEMTFDIPRDGTKVFHIRCVPAEEGGASSESRGVLFLAADMSVERRLQKEVLEAQEFEKARIGLDIHDSLCQELGGIGLIVNAMERQYRAAQDVRADELAEVVKMLNETTERARKLARGLSPVILDDRTLVEALDELLETMGEFHENLECRFENDLGDVQLEESCSIQLFLIAREALYNATRHGAPTQVRVRLRREGDQVGLSIEDNGGGKIEEFGDGLGNRSMKYRARILGGDLEIKNAPGPQGGEGIGVYCRVPLVSPEAPSSDWP